jgi:hypothetical protein
VFIAIVFVLGIDLCYGCVLWSLRLFSYLLYYLDGSYIFVIHTCFFIVLFHVLAHCVLFLFYTLWLLLDFLVCFSFSSLILWMFLISRFCCLCFLFLILDPFSLLLFLLFALDVVRWSLFVFLVLSPLFWCSFCLFPRVGYSVAVSESFSGPWRFSFPPCYLQWRLVVG